MSEFDTAQKNSIRFYLGYPNTFHQTHPRLEQAFTVVAGNDGYSLVVEILTQLDALRARLSGNAALASNGVKKLDEIEFFPHASGSAVVQGLIYQGDILVNQLSSIFGVPKLTDVFGRAGYPGDFWQNQNFCPFG